MAYNTFGRYRYTQKDSARRWRRADRNIRLSLVSSNMEIPMTNDEKRTILEHIRFYLVKLPMADQNFTVNKSTTQLTNEAVPLLLNIEMGLPYNVSAQLPLDDSTR